MNEIYVVLVGITSFLMVSILIMGQDKVFKRISISQKASYRAAKNIEVYLDYLKIIMWLTSYDKQNATYVLNDLVYNRNSHVISINNLKWMLYYPLLKLYGFR